MTHDDEQILFEATKQHVADATSATIEEGCHQTLIYAAMMSCISEVITTEGFWGPKPPDLYDLRGFWTLMHLLQQKAFADLAAG
jgi:hypothetical protein